MSMASGVIVAKAKCMYGNQLKKEHYDELLRKKNVAEIAGFLKNETQYAEALKDVRENNIHRGQLEDILRRDMFKKTMKLYRYADSSQKKYYLLHVQRIEIDLILLRIRVLISQEFDHAIAELPIFLKGYTSYDLLHLGNARTFDELLDVVKKTMYYKTLVPFRVMKGKENTIDYTAIESTLLKQYYANSFCVIDAVMRGKQKRDVAEFLSTEVELANITKIYRYKKFFNAREDVIRASLFPVEGHITKSYMEALLAEKTADSFLKKLQKTKYHITILDEEQPYIEQSTQQILYDMARHNFCYAQNAPLVFTSFLLLVSTELENIINIIEGIRYKVNIEDIEKMLIY